MTWVALTLILVVAAGAAVLHIGTRWGSTPAERARDMPGDDCLAGGSSRFVAMTRAISVHEPPERVWPWIAQLGRGAGWYSIDWLDNGRRMSARHIVSWIPEPAVGDASAIGYLRDVDPGRSLAWWADGVRFFGARARLVTSFGIYSEGQGTRIVSRMSADAAGPMAPTALSVFRVIDSIMARQQLLGLRDRVEFGEEGRASWRSLETGTRDQYQLYEVIYASGTRAGVQGEESAAKCRDSAIRDGVLTAGPRTDL